ncbi:hypothetical protein [Catenovulum agarivorans]|uniref:hypothetical protein n=1 Tax=Catenovulum agarivorans TaxID=1172192 RepID=UPI0002F0AAFB|nr:hypothetical protein [Catenovulum agarivorans]
MQNQLNEQLTKLEQSVDATIKAPFMKQADYAKQMAQESLKMCRLLVAENNELRQKLEALTNV